MNNAATRILADEAYDSNYQNNDKDRTWQRKMDEGYHGKPRVPGRELPEGTFEGSASSIAQTLKSHSEDYAQAMSKLTSYINRQGINLQGADKARLSQAKDALRQAYGEQVKAMENSMYALPLGHNLDDSTLKTGIDEPYDGPHPSEEVEDPMLNAATRLLASIYNSVQDPSSDTTISQVEADKWSKEVTDHDNHNAVPEGTFDKSAEDIAKTLKRVSKDHGQASDRIQFYINRGGKKVDHAKLEKAKDALKNLYKDNGS